MARCRDAIQSENWAELAGIVHGIAAKARRVVEVGRAAIGNARDPSYKSALQSAVKRLERGELYHTDSGGLGVWILLGKMSAV